LVNNAGVSCKKRAWDFTDDDWHWVHGVCFWGAVHTIQSFVPAMVERGERGHVLNVASMAALISRAGNAAYDSAKAGLIALTESLELDFRDAAPHLTASLLCPGYVATTIAESERRRPNRFRQSGAVTQGQRSASVDRGAADPVAALAYETIVTSQFYALADWDFWRPIVDRRFQSILDRGDLVEGDAQNRK
jgi:NAD(P)-dependent dehydrogenase (short-subunit alcohol dehydrogenase family)